MATRSKPNGGHFFFWCIGIKGDLPYLARTGHIWTVLSAEARSKVPARSPVYESAGSAMQDERTFHSGAPAKTAALMRSVAADLWPQPWMEGSVTLASHTP